MPMPSEYQRAGECFDAFLTDVRDACELGSRHQAYTTAQGVFRVFRRPSLASAWFSPYVRAPAAELGR